MNCEVLLQSAAYQSAIEALCGAWTDLNNEKRDPQGIFLPFVGRNYGQSPRLMIIGKATACWDPEQALDPAARVRIAEGFIREDVLGGRYTSPFWRFNSALAKALGSGAADASLESIAWSNLLRIAVAGRNPTGAAADRQRDASEAMLRTELQLLAPDIVVLLVHEYEGALVDRVFGRDWKRLGDEKLGSMVSGDRARRVYYCPHPQGQYLRKAEARGALIQAIVEDWTANGRREA